MYRSFPGNKHTLSVVMVQVTTFDSSTVRLFCLRNLRNLSRHRRTRPDRKGCDLARPASGGRNLWLRFGSPLYEEFLLPIHHGLAGGDEIPGLSSDRNLVEAGSVAFAEFLGLSDQM